jgi:tetratricopeptide (TPR) repeat protein
MELIDGGTLADLMGLSREPDGRRKSAAIVPLLRLVQRLCEPLAFIHAQGIVHRDLKPQNVTLRSPSNEPVLVDFGLIGRWSAVLARESLEIGGELSGTVDYMAPEQLRGEYVDARADLYSLGCLLYEVVTGGLPFSGSFSEIVMQHFDRVPIAPARIAPEVPPAVNEVILRLLEKDPRRRIGFAEDVAVVLAEVTEAESSAPLRAFPYLYRPAFVGRGSARAALGAAIRIAQNRQGSCTLIAGESGVGKTRLAMELTRIAAAQHFQVIIGECAAAESRQAAEATRVAPLSPLQPLFRHVASRCAREGAEATGRLLGRRAKTLSVYEPTLRFVPGFDAQPDPTPLPPAAERARVLNDAAEVLSAVAASEPLLLVIDDLQWADDMTLALLQSLGKPFFERAPVVIVGTFRSEELSRTPALGRLSEQPHVQRFDLGRLTPDEVGAMIASMLAMDVPPASLVRRLGHETEGNPFFVAEYLRAAVEVGFLQRTPIEGWRFTASSSDFEAPLNVLPLPTSVGDLVQRRLDNFTDDTRGLLEAAAVLGRDFDLDLARELAGYDEKETLNAIHQLVHRCVIEESPDRRLRFAHDKLREVTYARLPTHRTRDLHHRAALGIEVRAEVPDALGSHYSELAHHWELGGDTERSVHYLGLAGERALRTGAHNDSHSMLLRALERDDAIGRPGGLFRRARWERMLGVAVFGLGDFQGSIDHSSSALIGMREPVPRTAGGWLILTAMELMRTLAPTRATVTDPALRDWHFEVSQASGQLATAHFYHFDALPTLANLLRGLNRARRAGDGTTLVESCARLGLVLGSLGLDRVARSLFRRAHLMAERAGDSRGNALALYLDAMYQEFRANWEGCRELAQKAYDALASIGDQPEAETALAILSHGYFYAGDVVHARECGAAILRAAETRAHRHHVAWGLFLTGRCDTASGQLDAAVEMLERSRRLLLTVRDTLDTVICEGWLVRALHGLGRFDEALNIARVLGERLSSGKTPALPQVVDSYDACAEVSLDRWERMRNAPGVADEALRACAAIRKFARIVPMAVPAARRCVGRALLLRGRRAAGLRSLEASVHSARTLRMPMEEARSQAFLAHVLGKPESDRDDAECLRTRLEQQK